MIPVSGDNQRKDVYPYRPQKTPEQLSAARRRNNPRDEPTGPFTGRCPHCGSKNLWDDGMTTAYGCNDCGTLLGT